ncbi:triacylglycerol lipase [Fusarium subglutinans]|uniref:Triacylglycerol lipase n=1 Tax=Gibberella subglutinans TaxID=42677 RepID=A0A8H5QDD8_GIBSU|nr:triacylglycerol lipase [Fusarium subglutinans]KAF5612412.1 triacylglycerol lipase [Fusarium subglutinans]
MTDLLENTTITNKMADFDAKTQLVKGSLPWTRRVAYNVQIRAIQATLTTFDWLGSFTRTSANAPNVVKTYNVRGHLPVRIFLPSSYEAGSSKPLPTLFTIHGGGFCIGSSQDDDAWNRSFSDTHSVLVIALNYSKAPAAPFPTGLDDLVSLYHAALDDESLPIDKADGGRVAICGFSAGGNLSLGLSQRLLQSDHCACPPRATISVYGALDLSRSPEAKLSTRQYKVDASLGSPRTSARDLLLSMAPLFDWSYLPDGQDLRDPLLSPGPYADPDDLPPHVFIIASELDMLAKESLECATRLARARGGSGISDAGSELSRCGRSEPGNPGELELEDKRFAWQETFSDGSVRWLLVPDVLHGFDSLPMRERVGDKETIKDAELKTKAYCNLLGDWLLNTVFDA